jgi:hypothetical protein
MWKMLSSIKIDKKSKHSKFRAKWKFTDAWQAYRLQNRAKEFIYRSLSEQVATFNSS